MSLAVGLEDPLRILFTAVGVVDVLLVRNMLGIRARLLIYSRAYVGSHVVYGVLLTQLLLRSAIHYYGIVVIMTVDCANTHIDSAYPSGDSHSQSAR